MAQTKRTEDWVRQHGQGKVIALIHGLGADDPRAYWKDFLAVLQHDEQFKAFDIFVWHYPTHVQPRGLRNALSTLKRRTLRETAPRIAHLGAAWGTTYHAQFQGYQDVFLVCHSMGGLVVKAWILHQLAQGQRTNLATLRHIAFYATPHQGAPITTLAHWNTQLKDMRLDSPFIEEVSRGWHDHVVAWRERFPESDKALYNGYIPHVVLAGLNDAVVPPTSATIQGIPLTQINGDHSRVIQPSDSHDTRYKVWSLQVHEMLNKPPSQPVITASPDTPYNSAQATSQAPSILVHALPRQVQSFVGRDEDIAWLLQQFASEAGITLALCGPGGMGKTALAAEVLTRLTTQQDWLECFPGGIFYHSFYRSPSLDVAFEELAHLFEEDPRADPRRAALRALSRRRMVLVFDGVEVLPDSLALREIGGRHVVLLLSRRHADAPDQAHCRILAGLPLAQGVELVQRLAGPRAADRTCVERLVQYVDGYPLALQLMGSYLSARQEEVADYLQWFEQSGLVALDHGQRQAESVPVLLQRTYNSLTPTEQDIFALQGLLAPAPFPVALVQGMLELPEREVRQALSSLVNLSVLLRPDLNYEVSHPLVHTFAKERLLAQVRSTSSFASDLIKTWRERLVATLTTYVKQCDRYDRTALVLWQPHILTLLSVNDWITELDLKVAYLFNKTGFMAYTQGKYAEAEPLYKQVLAICEEQLEASHPDIAINLNNLAMLYAAQGKYGEAEPLYERALAICEKELGPSDPDTANSLNNLAMLYHAQGRYAEAEPLYERALAIREEKLGGAHPGTASSLNNLAALYRGQGKHAEAEPLLKRALAISEDQLGASHPDTASSLNNLAVLYESQRKYAGAEPLLKRALAISEDQLGASHPDTAQSLNNLAALYADQGKYTEAEPLQKRALAIYEKELGASHPDTAQSLNNLAMLYYSQERYVEAEPLLQRALAIREEQLGPSHPKTATNLNNLAMLYAAQGKYGEAEPLYKRALAICEEQLGAMHPDTATSLHNLTTLYVDQGKYAEAEPLYQRALAICEEQLGASHPETARSLNNLATLYVDQGKYAEAEPLLKRALAIREEQLGASHPDTARSLNNLALFYYDQEKYAEAEPLYKRALVIFEKELGITHPSTQTVRRNYAILLQKMKDAEAGQE